MRKKPTRFCLNGLPEYTDEAILNEIRRVAALVDPEALTETRFKTFSRVGVSTVRRHFGTWREALRVAGLEHMYSSARATTQKMKVQFGKGMSDEQLTEMVREVARQLSVDTLTIEDFNQHAPINAATVRRRFGGWGKALTRAGLSPSRVQRRYTDEECLENLLRVWTHYGRPPRYHEMPTAPSMISVRAYIRRWGSWRKALEAFVDHMGSDENAARNDANSVLKASSATVKKSTSARRMTDGDSREIKLRLRYNILKRDAFRCVDCGRSPATTPGLELHVDHILPWSKGGKTVPSNLRTTCADCNIGKGDMVEQGHEGTGE